MLQRNMTIWCAISILFFGSLVALTLYSKNSSEFLSVTFIWLFVLTGLLIWIAKLKWELENRKWRFYKDIMYAASDGKLEISEQDAIFRNAGRMLASWQVKNASDLRGLRMDIERIAKKECLDEIRLSDLQIAVGEAATNALKYAGGGTAYLYRSNGKLTFIMADNGPGISAKALPELAFKIGYTTAQSLGMGFKMMLAAVDKVSLATSSSGTVVALETSLDMPCLGVEKAAIPEAWRV